MTKEEVLIKAIGMLPDEMVSPEEMEELTKQAVYIGKKEKKNMFLRRGGYVLALAACFAVIIIITNVNKNYNSSIPEVINDTSIKTNMAEENNNSQVYSESKNKGKENGINCFVLAGTGKKETETCQDSSSTKDTNTELKKVPQGSTVKLTAVNNAQNKSTSKKTTATDYIVFSFDKDFYISIPSFMENQNTYIMDKENSNKHYIKKDKELCRAGDYIYFDISGVKDNRKNCEKSIPEWDKKGIEITAFAEIYRKKENVMEQAGVFYVGIKENRKTERSVYYGIFK